MDFKVNKKYASANASLVQLGEADSAASREIIYFRCSTDIFQLPFTL